MKLISPARKVKTYLSLLLSITIFLVLVLPTYASTVSYIHTNHQGSVVEVTDESGEFVENNRYYVYGEDRLGDQTLNTNNQSPVSERNYTSQIQDSETSLYYYNARYYDPSLSTFISADDQSGGNRFSYVSGNPIMFTDPTGNIIDQDAGGGGLPQKPKRRSHTNAGSRSSRAGSYPHSTGHDTSFFTTMFENDILSGPFNIARHLWDNMNDYNKVNIIVNYVHHSTEYAPELINIWEAKEEPGVSIDTANELLEYFPDPESSLVGRFLLKIVDRHQKLQEAESIIWAQKEALSPEEQFKQNLFVCYNYTDFASALIQEYVPDVTSYAAGLPGHAFLVVDIDGMVYTADPTWNLPLRPMWHDMAERPYFDWDLLDYNPRASGGYLDGTETMRMRFEQYKELSTGLN